MLLSEIERRREAPEARRGEIAALRGDVARLDGELTRLADAIAAGGELKALTTAMQGRQRQRDETAARLEHLRGQEQAGEDFDVGVRVEQTREILNDLADTLEGSPAAGRMVLRGLLRTPITVSPVLNEQGKLVDWECAGLGTLDELLAGRLSQCKIPAAVWPWPVDVVLGQPAGVSNGPQSQWAGGG